MRLSSTHFSSTLKLQCVIHSWILINTQNYAASTSLLRTPKIYTKTVQYYDVKLQTSSWSEWCTLFHLFTNVTLIVTFDFAVFQQNWARITILLLRILTWKRASGKYQYFDLYHRLLFVECKNLMFMKKWHMDQSYGKNH